MAAPDAATFAAVRAFLESPRFASESAVQAPPISTVFPAFDANATPDDTDGHSYLEWACWRAYFLTVRGLLALGAQPMRISEGGGGRDHTPLLNACCGPSPMRAKIVRLLLEHNATNARVDINAFYSSAAAGAGQRFTPMHAAASYGNVAVLRVLLAYRINLLARWRKHTPRELAHTRAHYKCSGYLASAERRLYWRVQAVLSKGPWRPRSHHSFPLAYRDALRNLAVLAKALDAQGRVRYPQSCLALLPEELRQYLFALITLQPVPECWTL